MTTIRDMSIGYLLNDVTLLFRKHFDRRATRFNLTRAQWRALKCLHLRQGIRQSELAEFLEMEAIAVGRVIDRLQAAGFVERRADPNDRRCWRLYPTERANAVAEDMEEIAHGLREDATRDIDMQDLQHMIDVLTRIKENLQALDGGAEADAAVLPSAQQGR
ncbi:MarR family winged helix-turn-helix transcriptional regulator [Oleiagrimonas soli]|uniref:MarR family transcriptional regulator n=2 Tax=Oleiagrimonas soli TaxID=1543381 RepID=A0A099CTN1_9GAMM|nr:MarR family transcriptional regulator [Oleiagrimonas soli]